VKELQLVGVRHGVEITDIFGIPSRYEVMPPGDFVEQLDIGQSSSVAIEAVPGRELTAGIIEESEFVSHELYQQEHAKASQQFFFGAASRQLEQYGHQVLGIDDARLRLEVYPKHEALLAEEYLLEYHYGVNMPPRVERKLAFSRAFIGFMDSTIREDLQFQRLSEGNFDLAIIGEAHGDILATDTDLQEELGVRVVDYRRSGVSYIGLPIDRSNYPRYPTKYVDSFLYQPNPNELANDVRRSLVEKELYRRRYNAFTIGRILGRSEQLPDYVGRFHISGIAESSLFELHITDRVGAEFQGKIYDVLGDAAVQGTFDSISIEFRKDYDLSTTMNPNIRPLIYRGMTNQSSGNVHGRYSLAEDTARSGFCFVMTKFDKSAIHRLNDHDVVYEGLSS